MAHEPEVFRLEVWRSFAAYVIAVPGRGRARDHLSKPLSQLESFPPALATLAHAASGIAAAFGEDSVKTHVRVLVIGGGVVGVSTLYHLTKKGWTDVALIERTELTAGSTWHAAGLLPLFNMSYTVGQLHKYSVDLYKRLPAETGQDVSFHVTGNLRLATCRERMDEYQKYCGTANTIGVPFEVITPQRVKELWPLVELGGSADTPAIVGALYHPDDGHIAPADLTMALRKGARTAGAEIYEHTEAHRIERTAPASGWCTPARATSPPSTSCSRPATTRARPGGCWV